jgi:hypothetical protein
VTNSPAPIPHRIVRLAAGGLALLGLLFGCEKYEPMPLDPAANARLQPPSSSQLQTAAAEIRHPLLKPVEINLAQGLTPDQAAVVAVLVNPELRAIRNQRGTANAALIQAGLLPNPVLTYSSDFVTGGFRTGTFNACGATLSWDFAQLISHAAKVEAAKDNAASVDLSVAWQEWQTAEAAKMAVYDLVTLQAQLAVLEEIEGMIPPGARYTLGGQYEEQQAVFAGVTKVIAAAGSLVFLLLLFLYEKIRVAVSIMLMSGLAVASVFIGLRLTGTELNISSMMGMVMIVGNITEVGIFYYSEFAALPAGSTVRDRLIAAGNHRLRAITMTTVVAILALLPLAISFGGHGGGMLQPLAIAIITGLVVQLPLVLIVLPAVLVLLQTERDAGMLPPSDVVTH